MATCRFIICAAALLLLLAGIARAETITLYDVDKGFYSEAGEYDPDSWEGYTAGKLDGVEYRNFFVFNLTDVVDQIISAKLVVNTQDIAGDGGTYTLHNVETDVPVLTDGGLDLVDVFTDLGEGPSPSGYGSLDISIGDEYSDVEIPLGEAFLTDVNAAGGLFAIGGALSPLTENIQYVFGWYGESDARLVVETIPEPGTAVLLAMGAAATIVFTRRHREKGARAKAQRRKDS